MHWRVADEALGNVRCVCNPVACLFSGWGSRVGVAVRRARIARARVGRSRVLRSHAGERLEITRFVSSRCRIASYWRELPAKELTRTLEGGLIDPIGDLFVP